MAYGLPNFGINMLKTCINCKANAALIAAAPDLLAAARDACAWFDEMTSPENCDGDPEIE